MNIYRPGSRGRHSVYVQPGNEHPNSDFVDADGKATLFDVAFKEGVAEVPDNLGNYMIDKGLAQRSPILLPS